MGTADAAGEDGKAGDAPAAGGHHIETLTRRLTDWRDARPGEARLDAMRATAEEHRKSRWTVVADLELETVTPLYGGGSTAGTPDLLLPVRPRAVRNGIRHWWWWLNRFDADGRLRPPKDLFERMRSLWGEAAGDERTDPRSRVRVMTHLLSDEKGVEERRFTYLPYQQGRTKNAGGLWVVQQNASDPWLYALFPAKGELRGKPTWASLDGAVETFRFGDVTLARLNRLLAAGVFKEKGMPHDLLLPGLRFRLRIEVAADCDAAPVALAVLAWQHFGGIGARTSRGLGQLRRVSGSVQGVADNTEAVEHLLGLKSRSWVGPPVFEDPMAAWQSGIGLYRQFRQLRDPKGRHRPPGREGLPGRSFWPKADVVRALSGRDAQGAHRVRHKAVGPKAEGSLNWPLPELFFGAPIGVRFTERKGISGEPAPVEITHGIEGQAPLKRFASPVRLGVVKVGEKWSSRVICLPYQEDLGGVGACVRNATSADEQEFRTSPGTKPKDDGIAHIPAGGWWPKRDDHFGQRAADIWSGTPGGADANAEFLRGAGARDPIEVLFEFLRSRGGG